MNAASATVYQNPDYEAQQRAPQAVTLDTAIRAAETLLDYLVQQRPMTQGQKKFIEDICSMLNVPPPEGFPSVTQGAASQFIGTRKERFYLAKRQAQQAQPGQGGRR